MSQPIKVVPLGAGQDVGKSCILLSIGGKNIMFDCGMHMGFQDSRRFPDFSYISKSNKNLDNIIDCVIITHFHLDHCGALPYFTEMVGYNGPVYMTHPTKAICPVLLEDYRKITVERMGETNFFTTDMIKTCMKKVIPVNIHQTIQVDDELEIRPYYAGHVLGAAMYYVRVGDQSAVYTGDYNMTPDRHLGAAWIERLRPDLLITETTYATTIRDSKRARERNFLKRVHEAVERGGKVLIPVFALGRAQELCILIDAYWERMNLTAPIYFSAGMTERANEYYKLYIGWTNENVKATFVERNMFDFKHIRSFDRTMADQPGPMVLFATPGMLHAGTSLEVFKKWAPNEKNLVIIPGYCVVGTVGNRLLTGSQRVQLDARTWLDVRCQVKPLSFSAHADAKGIMALIRRLEPSNVMLVHGEKKKMAYLKRAIVQDLGIPTFDPPNGTAVTLNGSLRVPVQIPTALLQPRAAELARQAVDGIGANDKQNAATAAAGSPPRRRRRRQSQASKLDDAPSPPLSIRGAVLLFDDQTPTIVDTSMVDGDDEPHQGHQFFME
mmetsp:Transcript_17939/g.31385  ORF Transcript_17939/g.31385 Transcript_17939/m.31385 type:complete len:554 (+) Transcript_17939:61-1722(+)